MGPTYITAARIKTVGANGRLNIDRFPVTGLVTTHSIVDLITDSAAGATALACGFKTRNGMVGVLPDTTRVLTLPEALQKRGYATGLVVTSSITHATPACFASHVASRNNHQSIAVQLLQDRVDVLLGGGRQYFLPRSAKGSKRSDDLDLIARAQQEGYAYVESADELRKTSSDRVLGLFQTDELTTDPPEPSLAEMAAKAIQILSKDEDGFFLMVEGSQIDWAGHDNDFDEMVDQLLKFDDAVAVGLDFAEHHPHTLILITADHETGGLNILGGAIDGHDLKTAWATGHHTGQMVPLFAYGPSAEKFTGVKDNTDIPKILGKLLGLENFPAAIPKSHASF